MCGLVGMVGTLEYKHKKVMMDLLFLDTLRGKDSTGLSAVSREKMVLTRKMTVPGYEFIEHPIVEKAMKHRDQLWIGHNRFKTTGEISRANAHPFEVLDDDGLILLVGAHNGTLNNKYELERKLDEKFDTDSEALFNWFVDAPNYKEAASILRGAWSLVWWDPTTDNLHFLRNEERPLTYAFTKDGKVMVWASEPWMIINACRRNNVELAQNDKGLSCAATLTNTLYSLEIPQNPDEVLPDLRREGGYTGAPVPTFHKPNNSWWGQNRYEVDPNSDCFDTEAKGTTAQGAQKEKTNGKKEESNVVVIGTPGGRIKGFGGVYIDVKEFDKIKAKGCGWCKGEVGDSGIFAFLNEDTIVCSRCIRDCHPKEGVRRDNVDPLDDELPVILTAKGKEEQKKIGSLSKDSREYKTLIAAAAEGAKAVG